MRTYFQYFFYTLQSFLVLTLIVNSSTSAQDSIQDSDPRLENEQKSSEPTAPIDPCDSVEDKVNKGTLATVGTFGSVGAAVDSSGGNAGPGEEASLIMGSIKFLSDTKCEAVLISSSKCNKYNVSFEVRSSKGGGSLVTSNSASLLPGQARAVKFSCKREENYLLKITKSTASRSK